MKACSDDIKEMLEQYDSSSSDVTLYPIFIGKQPAEPFECICIFDTPGWSPDLTFNRDEKYERPSMQIRVVSNSYVDGWNQIESIKNILHGRANETWGNTFYALIRCSSGPGLLDFDKNQRVRFVINFDMQRREII